MQDAAEAPIDLAVDFMDLTDDRRLVTRTSDARAVAVVADVTAEGIVHVQPLAGPVEDHLHLLAGGPSDG